MNQQTIQAVPQKRGCSPLAIILAGCGTVLLLGVVSLVVVGFLGYRWVAQKADDFTTKYEDKGYQHVTGQVIDEKEPIDSSRVYTAQSVIIRGDVDADLAIMSQMAEIHGTVNGDIDFLGQILIIKPNAVVTGDIRIETGQIVQIQGTVEGNVTGSYQMLDWPDKPASNSDDPEVDPDDAVDNARDVAAEADPEQESAIEESSPEGP